MTPSSASPQFDTGQSRGIRVFVSSAFADMGPEREELVKRAFPQLRKMCETRGVTWSEVDLRWGVTEEAVAEDRAAEICLREVDRCHPFFIGILGTHYGPLTAQEIDRGALGQPAKTLARFYFRSGTGVAALEELKTRIRESGLTVRDGYRSPQELGEWIRADFEQLIERLFPASGTPDSEDVEQNSFALSRTAVYVERPALNDVLDRHFMDGRQPLVVTGEAGSGKSALLARWADRMRVEHPEALVVFHSIGASTYSADWRLLVRRLIQETAGEIPADLAVAAWRDALQRALDRAAAQRTVVVLIDALNQLDDVDNAQDLAWLPESFAPGVRVVLSTLAGTPLDEVRRRGFPEAVVAPLTAVEKREVIQKYLDCYGKELSEARTARLCAAEAASNPLFLRALLDELRQFGSFSRLDERLARYLQAQVPEDLFGMILERYEADYERERPGLVRDACSFLLAARRGLSEAELLDVTGGPEGPLPHLYWSPLFLAAESSLVTRSGLLNFAHEHIRRAANRRYGGGRGAHGDLAAYFRAREPGRRKAEELPWQLQQAERWDTLRDVLLDPPFLADIWEVNRTDLKRYWANLETRAGLNPAREYRPFLDQCERLGQYALFVANLLDDSGYPKEAGRIYEYLADHVQDPKSYAGILGNLALLRKRSGDLDGAYELHKREEAICREQKDEEGLQRSLNHQAQILSLQGKRRDALELHKEEEAVARGRGDSVGLAACLGNQAIIQRKLGNTDEALALHREGEQLYRSAGDRMGVQDALFNQAIVYWQKGEFERGLGMFVDRERQARELGDRRWLAKAVGMQGVVHQSVGRFNQAFDCFEEQARICREIHDWTDSLSALNNAGRILVKLGRHREALARLAELERLCRERESPGALQACLQNQGEAYLAGDDARRALGCFQEQERICDRIGDLPGLGAAIGCQGLAWQRLGRAAEAMALRKREEAIARQLDDPDMLQVSLTYQAELLGDAREYDAAFAMYSAADDIARRIHAWDGLRVSLGMSGALHEQLGHNAEALAAYREQQQLARGVGNRYAEERALHNQARVLIAKNDLDGALLVTRQLETLAANPTDGAREAVNQAAILDEMDRHAEAVDAARRALDLLGAVEDSDDVTAIRELAHEILDEKADES